MSNAVFTVAATQLAVADFTWCEVVNVPRKSFRSLLVLGLFEMMKDGVSAEGRRTMQILHGGGEAHRRERVQADAGQSWVPAAQATHKQGCQDVDSCRDGHVRATMTTGPGIQRVRFHKRQRRCTANQRWRVKPVNRGGLIARGAGDKDDGRQRQAHVLRRGRRAPNEHHEENGGQFGQLRFRDGPGAISRRVGHRRYRPRRRRIYSAAGADVVPGINPSRMESWERRSLGRLRGAFCCA